MLFYKIKWNTSKAKQELWLYRKSSIFENRQQWILHQNTTPFHKDLLSSNFVYLEPITVLFLFRTFYNVLVKFDNQTARCTFYPKQQSFIPFNFLSDYNSQIFP